VAFLINNKLEGVVNVIAPKPLSTQDFTKAFAQNMNTTIATPQPAWLLKIGAAIIRTETELLLKSRCVLPKRLQDAGLTYKFARVDECISHLVDS
jgi:hypothetical protein